jgi:hypothetical protein
MLLSQDILSLDPRKVDQAVLEFFRASMQGKEIEATHQALMHRIASYIHLANEKKSAKAQHRTELSQAIQTSPTAEDLARKLEEHIFTPAFTAHPTNPKSIETDELLADIYNLFMLIRNEMAAGERSKDDQAEKNQTIRAKLVSLSENRGLYQVPQLSEDAQKDREYLLKIAYDDLADLCVAMSDSKLQPESKLEVSQEVERNLGVFKVAFGEFNKFKRRVVSEYCETHQITDPAEIERITKVLTPAVARQFQEIHFWSGSDADGNDKITHQTMLDAILKHQEFLDELYLAEIEKIKNLYVGHDFVLRELFEIKQIIEGVEAQEAAGKVEQEKDSKKIVERIDALIAAAEASDTKLTVKQRAALDDLRDSFECFGFVGPKMDVRQSSFRNVTSMQQILDFLRSKQVEGSDQFVGNYSDEGFKRKEFCSYLKDPQISDIILRNLDALAPVAQAEIRRMIVAKQYPDSFHRYIISDNKGIESWEEVRALEAIAYKAVNPQATERDSRPLQIYPLCETREDIDNLPAMIERLLEDPQAVATLHGRLDLFIGYSDAEKRAGIGALALLQQRVNQAKIIIDRYNAAHPDSPLRVEIFHAHGNDLIRGGDKPSKLTTEQGQGAMDFLFKQRLKTNLEAVAGSVDDADLQLEEWNNLPPQQTVLVSGIVNRSTAAFEEFVSHGEGVEKGQKHGDRLAAFLLDVSMSDALAETNQSSRKKAKGAGEVAALNLDSERAIGLATRFSACGIHANVYYGMAKRLPDGGKDCPQLFENLTVVRDMVYKTFYALAITDFSRAEKIATINGKAMDPEMVIELRESAFDALENLVQFLPLDDFRSSQLMDQITGYRDQAGFPVSEATKRIMSQLPEFPVVRKLLASAQDNEQNYQKVIHAKLDEYRGVGADRRKELDSDLAILFREEMRIPHEINSLTSETPITQEVAAVRASASGLSLPLQAQSSFA